MVNLKYFAILLAASLPATGKGTDEETTISIPICVQPTKGESFIGSGQYGLHFFVPKKETKVIGVKPDIDNSGYVIQPKKSKTYLRLWVGYAAFYTEPYSEARDSRRIVRNRVVDTSGAEAGMDVSGEQATGKWRHFRVRAEEAHYQNASKDDAALFDKIIESACEVPQPKK